MGPRPNTTCVHFYKCKTFLGTKYGIKRSFFMLGGHRHSGRSGDETGDKTEFSGTLRTVVGQRSLLAPNAPTRAPADQNDRRPVPAPFCLWILPPPVAFFPFTNQRSRHPATFTILMAVNGSSTHFQTKIIQNPRFPSTG